MLITFKYFGWRQGSKMPQVYVHLSGRNIDDRLLELHGLKPKRENGIKLKVQICPRCQAKNTPANKFCSRCSSALDLKTALQVDQRIEKAEEVMETLLRDPQVKALLAEKIRELGLAEKLT